MKATTMMIVGPLLSIAGLYLKYKKRDVSSWMDARRIDKIAATTVYCPECGKPMVRRTYKTGHRAGSFAMVCSEYPKCKGRKWGA